MDNQRRIERLEALLGRIRERAADRTQRASGGGAPALAADSADSAEAFAGRAGYEPPAPTQPSEPPPEVMLEMRRLEEAPAEDVFEHEPMEDLGDDFEPVSDELVVVDEALTSEEIEKADESGELHILDDSDDGVPESESRRRAAREQVASSLGDLEVDLESPPPESGQTPVSWERPPEQVRHDSGPPEGEEIEVDFSDEALVSGVEQTRPLGSELGPISAVGEEAELPTGGRAAAATYDASLQAPVEAQEALERRDESQRAREEAHLEHARSSVAPEPATLAPPASGAEAGPIAPEMLSPALQSPAVPVAEFVSGDKQLPSERFVDCLDASLNL